MRIVWFKRDLRVQDHAALSEAAALGPVLPLFVFEPGYWAQPDCSGRQYAFLCECVGDLATALGALGQPLIVRVGDAVAALEDVRARFAVTHLHSHQETGGDWTYARDRRVAAWAQAQGVRWIEHRQSGVIRAIGTRDGWARRWTAQMRRPAIPAPAALRPVPGVESECMPAAAALGVAPDPCPERQPGGRDSGRALLASFLQTRGQDYRRAMSSPLTAFEACSRLSPHLVWGTVSSREAAQAGWAALDAYRTAGAPAGFADSVSSFLSRLHWRCHFMQKLEREPRMEFDALHPAYADLRPAVPPGDERLERWIAGRTGWPFVDACMRALDQTGWLNFRMRAMAMAVASYHLWRPWRPTATLLARKFTDFEPGIHYPQAQMQSGVTGVNTVRVYNPVKQGRDQDPDAVFIARWVPELRDLAPSARHEPWKAGGAPGYPSPMVDHLEAAKAARAAVWGVRKGAAYRAQADAIQGRHGSRRSGVPSGRRRRGKPGGAQMTLDV